MPASSRERSPGFLEQRTVMDRAGADALRLPFVEGVERFHPGGCFPLVEDPRRGERAIVLGMMVLRPATVAWKPSLHAEEAVLGEIRSARDWCYDVDGIGGSWPVSAGDAIDAWRLALQYGTVDAVMAGAATFAREGLVAGARRGHLWQPYTPLSWAPLAARREELRSAIAAQRALWQELGVLSSRRWPAQVAITTGGLPAAGSPDLLDARAFHDRHPDGSPIECRILTSEAGAGQLRERARARGLRIDDILLVASSPAEPERLDVAAVPGLLRRRLGAGLVEHDGGALSLRSFVEGGAVPQLNLTLMRGRTVREVVASSDRVDAAGKSRLLAVWPEPARLFPSGGGPLPGRPLYALADGRAGGEAVCCSFDVRAKEERAGREFR